MPCSKCAGLIIQAGIRRVVSYASSNERWSEDFEVSRRMMCEAGVKVNEYVEGVLEAFDKQ